MSEGDEYYVVTGRDEEIHGEVTERWCRKHMPNAKGVYCVGEYSARVNGCLGRSFSTTTTSL